MTSADQLGVVVGHVDGSGADVDRVIGDAFEIGDDLERGGDEPEVAGHGLLEREQIDTVALDTEVPIVDLVIALDDLPG